MNRLAEKPGAPESGASAKKRTEDTRRPIDMVCRARVMAMASLRTVEWEVEGGYDVDVDVDVAVYGFDAQRKTTLSEVVLTYKNCQGRG